MKILLITAFLTASPFVVAAQSNTSALRTQDSPYAGHGVEHNWGWIGLFGLVGLVGLRRTKSATAAKWEAQGVNVKEVNG